MASIFDLAQSAAELPSLNQGTSKIIYEQHPPTRDVTGTNFPNGAIHFRWQVAGSRWWIPSRTYFRMRARINVVRPDNGGVQIVAPPTVGQNIAPNMSLMANIFQSGEFRIADKTVSRVGDYMAQVDALDQRLSKSKSWLDSVGKEVNWMEPDVRKRINEISSDGLNEDEKVFESEPAAVARLAAGFSALTTTAWVQATRLLTFAAGGVNLQTGPGILHKGDVIIMNGAGNFGANDEYEILEVISATTARANTRNIAFPGDINAEVDNFTIRQVKDLPSNDAQGKNQFEMIWQPPLSIFKVKNAMPSGKYEIVLNPQNVSQFQKRAIESLLADKVVAGAVLAAGTFQFVVDDFFLYLSTVEGPRMDDLTYFLDLEQTRAQTDDVQTGTSLSQRNFDVSPSTFALTLAFQDTTAGTDTQFSASKMKIRPSAGQPDGLDMNLRRMFIQFAG